MRQAFGDDLGIAQRSSEELHTWLENADRLLRRGQRRLAQLRTSAAGDPLRPMGTPWTDEERAEFQRLTHECQHIERATVIVRRLFNERNAAR
jgi:hypothetical protein